MRASSPRQRHTDGEKPALGEDRTAGGIWPDKPARAARDDTRARWTLRHSRAKARADGVPQVDIAIPVFGCKSHVGIDRRHGIVRRQLLTDASAHDGARLREGLVRTASPGREVRADTACRSAQTEDWRDVRGMVRRIHRRKPRGRPMSRRTSRANGRKSVIRAKAEHVFARQKDRMGLTIRTIGLARARAAITLASMVCNMCRFRWLKGPSAPA